MHMVFILRMRIKIRSDSMFSALCNSVFKIQEVTRPKPRTVKYMTLNKTESVSEEER